MALAEDQRTIRASSDPGSDLPQPESRRIFPESRSIVAAMCAEREASDGGRQSPRGGQVGDAAIGRGASSSARVTPSTAPRDAAGGNPKNNRREPRPFFGRVTSNPASSDSDIRSMCRWVETICGPSRHLRPHPKDKLSTFGVRARGDARLQSAVSSTRTVVESRGIW